MLAFVMLWAYFSFSQYLIIWSGNLPEEIAWYLHRLQTGWRCGRHRARFCFISRCRSCCCCRGPSSASRDLLVKVAIGMLIVRLVDLFWLIAPEFHQRRHRRSAGWTSCCRCRSARSGSAASSGSCAAARFCRFTIRSSTKRSAASSSAARRHGRPTSHGGTAPSASRRRTSERTRTPTVHHETSDVNIRGHSRLRRRPASSSASAIQFHGVAACSSTSPRARRSAVAAGISARRGSGRRVPPEPRLQTNPREDLRELRAQRRRAAHQYGWVDRNAGIVRIPIDEAMKLTLERGLPARQRADNDAGHRGHKGRHARTRSFCVFVSFVSFVSLCRCSAAARADGRRRPRARATSASRACRRRRCRRRCARSASTRTSISTLPLDTPFRDETGRAVRLGDYFGRRPVVLVFAYYDCPMLCTQVINGLSSALKRAVARRRARTSRS